MVKRIEVVIADFDNPGHGLPPLTNGTHDATCETTGAFYHALRGRGIVSCSDAGEFTMIQYDRSTGDSYLQVRNACCSGDRCSTRLFEGSSSFCGPQVVEVERMLGLNASGRDNFLLIVERGAELESSVGCVLRSLGENYTVEYKLGQPQAVVCDTSRPRVSA